MILKGNRIRLRTSWMGVGYLYDSLIFKCDISIIYLFYLLTQTNMDWQAVSHD